MSDVDYVFSQNKDARERIRLEALQTVHDPVTRRLLDQIGLGLGSMCAEIGAGAGSIAQHMAEAVGPSGRVVALDLDPRFLDQTAMPPLEVRRGDVLDPAVLEPAAYDFIHARFLLVHLAQPIRALRNIVRALKPGGVLLAEEPDFHAAGSGNGRVAVCGAVDSVNRAVLTMYRDLGRDPRFGLKLPAVMQEVGLTIVRTEATASFTPGGSDIALMMAASVDHLRQRLTSTGVADDEQIDQYRAAASDPAVWGAYYTTLSVVGRKSP
jgi:SAM-dependent methyltransferase